MTDRPLSSHEIQRMFGRMPTRGERSAFSRWRDHNLAICLECNYDLDDHPGLPDCTTHKSMREAKQCAADEFKYLPASYRTFDALQKLVGEDTAEAMKAYVADMIHEALHPANEE